MIVVKDVPGFYVNRALAPWAAEGLLLVQNGMSPEALDAAVKAFGYPVGPVTLADEVGVDVLYHTYQTMKGSLGGRMEGANDLWLKAMVDAKMLGRKSGKGFYLYDDDAGGRKGSGKKKGGGVVALLFGAKPKNGGKKLNPEAMELMAPYRTTTEAAIPPDVAVERMVLRFVKECIHSLEEGVIKSPGDGDIGAVFGLGFPPFLGGPFRWSDIMGARAMADKMQGYADRLGPRFAPPQILLDLAKSGGKFHAASGGGGARSQ